MSVITRVLPKMQAFSEGEMPDTVTIHTPGAGTLNDWGATVEGEATDTETKGRIAPDTLSNDLIGVFGGELRQSGGEVLTIPRDVAISTSASVTVVSARHGTTTVYAVQAVLPLSSTSVHRKVLVREK